MEFLWEGLLSITWQQAVMYVVGALLIYLAIEKDYEPSLLLPMGFGAIPGQHSRKRRSEPVYGRRRRNARYRAVAV